jgi:hypothetical protein
MSLKTLFARIANFLRREAAHLQIGRLAAAVEHDYSTVVTAAEKTYAKGVAEVETLAHDELKAIEQTYARLQQRAGKLLTLNVLKHPAASRAAAVVQATPEPAAPATQALVTATTGLTAPATSVAASPNAGSTDDKAS